MGVSLVPTPHRVQLYLFIQSVEIAQPSQNQNLGVHYFQAQHLPLDVVAKVFSLKETPGFTSTNKFQYVD